MATGDILSCTIVDKTTAGQLTDGWYCDVVIEGFTIGASYDFGLGSNNDPTSSNFVMTVTSEGYNAAGVLGTISRTVYGTRVLRQAFPNDTLLEESAAANLTVRVALSDFVYDDDRNGGVGTSGVDPTVAISAAWCTNAGGASETSNVISGLAVTNNSTQDYPKVKGGWLTPAGTRIGATYNGAVIVKHPFGQSQPCPAVKFTITDETLNTVSEFVATPTSRVSVRNPSLPQIEQYEAALSTSGLVDEEIGTASFVAYPYVGDENSILNSDDYTFVADREASQPHRLDIAGTYRKPFAYVSNSGDDGTGVVSETAATAKNNPYLTMFAARNAIRDFLNTNYAETNSVDGSHIRMMAETANAVDTDHVWGRSASGIQYFGNGSFLIIEPDPDAVGTPQLTTYGTTAREILVSKLRLVGMNVNTLTPSAYFRTVDVSDYIQLENMEADCNSVAGNLRAATLEAMAAFDCDLKNFNGDPIGGCVHVNITNIEVGINVNTRMIVGFNIDKASDFGGGDTFGMSVATISPFIAYGKVSNDGSPFFAATQDVNNTYIGHVVFERHTSGAQTVITITNQNLNDVHIEHAGLWGARFNAENNLAASIKTMVNVFVQGVTSQYIAAKHDVFANDGTVTGGWPMSYSVGWRNNYNGKTDAFPFDFFGLDTFELIGDSTPAVVDDNSLSGDNDTAVFGDYTPTAESVITGALTQSASAFDMNGNTVDSEIGPIQITAESAFNGIYGKNGVASGSPIYGLGGTESGSKVYTS